jgi:hypothetical protein
MANGSKPDDRDPKFSFGIRELREAQRPRPPAPAQTPGKASPGGTRSVADADAGFDPYNTSGSFDRRKHWERVGRR